MKTKICQEKIDNALEMLDGNNLAALDLDQIKELADQRQTARINKDWTKADSIRDQILEMGWIIEDIPDGFKLKPILER